jgi:hypothetical protein
VPGNHDYYSEGDRKLVAANPALRTTYERQRAEMPAVAADLGIILLDDAMAVIDGVRFVGGTLWTDMSSRPSYMSANEAMRAAERMNDYRLIKKGAGRSKDTLRPTDTIAAHRKSVAYIESVLTTPFAGDTVLVTHHPASNRSLLGYDPAKPGAFRDLDWCYATDLERWFIGEGMPSDYVPPALAIHGHVHANRDYVVGSTRIVANPRGYPAPIIGRENHDFDPDLVVEVGHDFTPGMRM